PERQAAVAEIELPAPSVGKIDELEFRAGGPDQPRFRADRTRIAERMPVAGQQQMIAVIDGEVCRGVEIGAAEAARLLGRLVDMHLKTGTLEPHGRRKAGNSSTDDMNCFGHQMIA